MSYEVVRDVLAERAEDVAGAAPDLDGLHTRVTTARRRRLARAVAGCSALAVVVVGGVLLGRGEDAGTPDPAPGLPSLPTPAPVPSPTTGSLLPRRSEPVEVQPTPYDRDTVDRARVLMTLQNAPGDPTLGWTVDRTADVTLVQASCRGATGSWLVVIGGAGSSTAMPCGRRGGSGGPGMRTMPLPSGLSPLLPDVGERLEAFVTTTDPHDASGPQRMRLGIPARTSAAFDLAVWGQDRTVVATLVGHEVSPLGEGAGREWWFTRGVEAATGADSLTLELPASPVDRVVQTVTDYARFPLRGTMPFVEISLDGSTVDHRFDEPRILFQDETSAFVPAGGPRTVVLRVTDGRPEHVDFGAAVFEAGD